MTKGNGKSSKNGNIDLKSEKAETGPLLQMGETIQQAIVSILDGSSTIFRSVFGTFKDSTVFAIRSTREVSDEFGKSLKGCILGTIEGTHEVSTKAASSFGKTFVDLSQCAYDTGSKVGNVAKSAALNTIRGSAEVLEELFGKIKSGAFGVIPLEKFKLGKKTEVIQSTDTDED